MGLREIVDVADQIVSSGFSTTELRNKAATMSNFSSTQTPEQRIKGLEQ
ncbi:hypothetical protein K08M4_27510 [Vibrio syngnathi]|uniref:Uncharacterized protein n=1 Tax=Vibrio syngnathi TaxID=3034029 RepID=A0AA34XPM3_9VIBR|nr:hypothetical protein K08M4_27510 [Vibrio syngnathi]